jgi:hypothetical protein
MGLLQPGATGRSPGIGHNRGPSIEPLCLTINDTARALGICRSSVDALSASGKIKIIRIAGRSLVSFASLKAMVDTEAAA